jgi:hypothetical protein
MIGCLALLLSIRISSLFTKSLCFRLQVAGSIILVELNDPFSLLFSHSPVGKSKSLMNRVTTEEGEIWSKKLVVCCCLF